MRYLGIDYGAKRIGIAISDAAGGFAFPKTVLPNDGKALSLIRELIDKENIEAIVIGDTRAVNGVENPITFKADRFAESLEELQLPIHRVWEAWSSAEAARFSPDATHDDSAAAAIILQRFLDAH